MTGKKIQNEVDSSGGQGRLSKIDIRAGDLTYEHRIDLGDLFASEQTDAEKFSGTFRILHKVEADFSDGEWMKEHLDYYREIIEGLQFWFDKEKELLDYNPEPEEIRAGIRELSAKIGPYGTIKAIAKNYARDPDEILKWKYGKVFGILYTDLEEFKYSQRLNKQYERKYKK
jgi:hypothetical protein